MKFVIAGSHHQFEHWLRENNLNRQDAIECSSVDRFRGITILPTDEIIRYGTWYDRSDLDEIEEDLREVMHRGRFILPAS